MFGPHRNRAVWRLSAPLMRPGSSAFMSSFGPRPCATQLRCELTRHGQGKNATACKTAAIPAATAAPALQRACERRPEIVRSKSEWRSSRLFLTLDIGRQAEVHQRTAATKANTQLAQLSIYSACPRTSRAARRDTLSLLAALSPHHRLCRLPNDVACPRPRDLGHEVRPSGSLSRPASAAE